METWVKKSGILGGAGKDPTVISPKQYSRRFRWAGCCFQAGGRAGRRSCRSDRFGVSVGRLCPSQVAYLCGCSHRIAMSSYLTVVPAWEPPEPPLDPDAM